MDYQSAQIITQRLRIVAVVLFAVRAALGYPTYTNRAGSTTAYTLANPANEYASIGGNAVQYDAAGNLTVDEAGRRYSYDERNRLIEVRKPAPDDTILASYGFDALGRRVAATIGSVTTRYYYDGQNVIEEYGWNGTAETARLRYHVNGTQFIDERVATFEDASGQFTYYLLKENYSVAGTGNADGSVIARRDYSATGSFAGSGGGIDVDYNDDGYVDADDLTEFEACASGPAIPQNDPNCAGMKLDVDDDVDQSDFGIFQRCYSGTELAMPECTGAGGGLPASGTFVLHGLPIDILPDGHAILFVRARFYDLKHGRWLQREPLGNVAGPNLYEAFASNPEAVLDPMGTEPELRYEGKLQWDSDGGTGVARIRVYNDGGYWGRSRNVAVFELAVRSDVRGRGDPRTRGWVVLGEREYLVNISVLRSWLEGLDEQHRTIVAGDPGSEFLAARLGESFLV